MSIGSNQKKCEKPVHFVWAMGEGSEEFGNLKWNFFLGGAN